MSTATIETDKGTIEIELYAESAPKATANFVELAQQGLLRRRHLPPHRARLRHPGRRRAVRHSSTGSIEGASAPAARATSSPTSRFAGDYVRGAVAMANAGPNTNGSQFFICLADLSGGRLPKKYTLFGQVTKGLDVVDAIAALKCDSRDLPQSRWRCAR